jgi:hypothetical protein
MRTGINGLSQFDYGLPLGVAFFIVGCADRGLSHLWLRGSGVVLLFARQDALGIVFEGNLELVEEGVFEPAFGQACMFDEEGDRDLAERMIVQVNLCGIGAVDFLLRRDHCGGS